MLAVPVSDLPAGGATMADATLVPNHTDEATKETSPSDPCLVLLSKQVKLLRLRKREQPKALNGLFKKTAAVGPRLREQKARAMALYSVSGQPFIRVAPTKARCVQM